MSSVKAEPGEVTLQVRFDGQRYIFQLLSQSYLFEPVLAEAADSAALPGGGAHDRHAPGDGNGNRGVFRRQRQDLDGAGGRGAVE